MEWFARRDGAVELKVRVIAGPKGFPVVAEAVASGDDSKVLDEMCAAITGLPLQEAADHGALHVVEAHRQGQRLPAVAGILTARAAGPAYVRAQGLIRGILADYRAQTGFAETRSTWNPEPAEAWRTKDEAARLADLAKRVAAFCAAKSLPAGAVRVGATEGDFRVTVELGADIPAADQPKLLLDLERALRAGTGNRFEVFLQEMQDKNLVRTSA